MDNIVSGLIGAGLFLALIVGLAHSIITGPAGYTGISSGLPFAIIVGIVSVMALFALYEDIRDDMREQNKKD